MRPTILVPLANHREIHSMYFEKGGDDGLFIRGDCSFEAGTQVDLELRFAAEGKSFHIRGEVKWRQDAHTTPPVPPGIGVIFRPESPQSRKVLLEFAMGKEVTLTHREDRRFGIELPVKTSNEGESHSGTTDDLSASGALIHTENPLPVGAVFDVTLRFPGHLFASTLQAKVIWLREDNPPGMGVQFVFADRRQQEQMEKLINQLKNKMLAQQPVRISRIPS